MGVSGTAAAFRRKELLLAQKECDKPAEIVPNHQNQPITASCGVFSTFVLFVPPPICGGNRRECGAARWECGGNRRGCGGNPRRKKCGPSSLFWHVVGQRKLSSACIRTFCHRIPVIPLQKIPPKCKVLMSSKAAHFKKLKHRGGAHLPA